MHRLPSAQPRRPLRPFRPLVGAVLAAAMGLGAAPARAGLFSDDDARQAIVDLRARYEKSEEARQAREAETARQLDTLRRSLLDLSQQIEQLRSELAQQRGSNELLSRDLSELQRKQKDVQQGLGERVAKLEPQKVTADGKEFMAEAEEKRDYDEAIARMRASDWDNAAALLTAFLKRWPGTGYRESALYWLGNARFAQKDYKEAIGSFRALIAAAPEHPRAPEALLAVANCHVELKQQKSARQVLAELVKAYPKSEAAQVARERLGAKS